MNLLTHETQIYNSCDVTIYFSIAAVMIMKILYHLEDVFVVQILKYDNLNKNIEQD